ncbi:MAG: alpha-L-fucosidase [Phycisphaerae bacterium]|jgi:alpha-L-fucosidase|nr:alpha-L-fucosidase [Phycisphaerae bacterium]
MVKAARYWIIAGLAVIAASAGVLRSAEPAKTAPAEKKYKPNWESIDSRPLPKWFNEAKFGIFVVWGPYSVPSWVDRGYAEWYWNRSKRKGSPTQKFHEKMYGKDFPYEKFAEQLTAKLYKPDYWCEIFARSGARYVVTTANYHDGFCLWDSPYSKTKGADKWNATVVGPKRNVLRELFDAGAKRGLKMGIYYSLYEWYHPLYLTDRAKYVDKHLHPQFKDVVTKFKPWFIFLDGEWTGDYKLWRSLELATWLYNESPCKDYVVTNDRWGKTRRIHGDVYSSEYGGGRFSPKHPWQEDRGIGHSYGYNRNEGIDAYDSEYTLIKMLSRVCGNGGNLLLDVGPTADGRIPVIMQDRLVRIGKWLKVNGEAIYGTSHSPFWPKKFPWGTCTAKGSKIFLHVWGKQSGAISLAGLKNKIAGAYVLGDEAKTPLKLRTEKGVNTLQLPAGLRDEHVVVLVVEVEGKPEVDVSVHQGSDGKIVLGADAAFINGSSPCPEQRGGATSIGYWRNPRDSVSWQAKVTKPGEFDVTIVYSCDKAAAGGEFTLIAGKEKLAGKTESTGGWDKFQPRKIGKMKISESGKCVIKLQPKSKPKWNSMGLRTIILTPATGN